MVKKDTVFKKNLRVRYVFLRESWVKDSQSQFALNQCGFETLDYRRKWTAYWAAFAWISVGMVAGGQEEVVPKLSIFSLSLGFLYNFTSSISSGLHIVFTSFKTDSNIALHDVYFNNMQAWTKITSFDFVGLENQVHIWWINKINKKWS